jgi:hypothetical protein
MFESTSRVGLRLRRATAIGAFVILADASIACSGCPGVPAQTVRVDSRMHGADATTVAMELTPDSSTEGRLESRQPKVSAETAAIIARLGQIEAENLAHIDAVAQLMELPSQKTDTLKRWCRISFALALQILRETNDAESERRRRQALDAAEKKAEFRLFGDEEEFGRFRRLMDYARRGLLDEVVETGYPRTSRRPRPSPPDVFVEDRVAVPFHARDTSEWVQVLSLRRWRQPSA